MAGHIVSFAATLPGCTSSVRNNTCTAITGNTYVYTEGTCQVFISVFSGATLSTAEAEDGFYYLQGQCQVQAAGGSILCNSNGSGEVTVAAKASSRTVKARDNNLSKRDTTFDLITKTNNAKPTSYRQHVIGLPNPGDSWDSSTDQSRSSTIEVSVSVSAGFLDIVSTSLGFDASSTETYDFSETITISNSCSDNEEAQVYWQPFCE